MRLTLRTLLAYMDGILEPNDTQDIGKKIEESEFASGLVHRIQDVMRRLRLGAPSLADREGGLDPNTVAEYLDNTLPNDRVADFEKVCLESDVHLAEVAACHQVLTLVLGEPADIDPNSRQSMYQLQDLQATSQVSAPAEGPVIRVTTGLSTLPRGNEDLAKPVMVGGLIGDEQPKPHPKPTVPEYLREPKASRLYSTVLAVVLLLVLGVATVLYYGNVLGRLGLVEPPQTAMGPPPGPSTAVHRKGVLPDSTQVRDSTKSAEKTQAAAESVQKAQAEASAGIGATAEKPSAKSPAPASAPPTPTAAASAPGQPPAAPADKTPKAAPSEEARKEPVNRSSPALPPPAGKPTRPETPPDKKLEASEAAGTAVANPGSKRPSTTPPAAASKPSVPQPASGKSVAAAAAHAAPASASSAPAKATVATVVKPSEPVATSGGPLGRLLSNDQVLLGFSPEVGWSRVAANQILTTQRLLALPTYRAVVSLNLGVVLDILGGTQLDILGGGPQAAPGIRITFGRVVVRPLTKAGVQIRVVFGGRSGMLQFNDAESAAALEVRRTHMPGVDPEHEPIQMDGELFAASGALSWNEGSPPTSIPLAPSSRLRLEGQSTVGPFPNQEVPQWTNADAMNAVDRLASPILEHGLQTERTARLGLIKMSEHRRREVRWLALRCLGYLGNYQGIVSLLADPDPINKTVWPDYVEYLRDAAARDRESAAAVRAALERQYPQGSDMYRMLWGYTNEQLIGQDPEHAEDANLVEGLNSDSLAVRRLSFWNLTDITGARLSYRPEETATRRQLGYQAWRNRLERKEIRIKPIDEKKAKGKG